MAKQIADIGSKLIMALVVMLLSVLMYVSIESARAANKSATTNATDIARIQERENSDRETLKRIEADIKYMKEKLVQHLIEGE